MDDRNEDMLEANEELIWITELSEVLEISLFLLTILQKQKQVELTKMEEKDKQKQLAALEGALVCEKTEVERLKSLLLNTTHKVRFNCSRDI